RVLPVRHAAKLAVGGLLAALAVAFVPVLAGKAPLQHAPGPGAGVVPLGRLELLNAVAFDVGVFALVLGMAVATIHLIAVAGDEEGGGPETCSWPWSWPSCSAPAPPCCSNPTCSGWWWAWPWWPTRPA